MQLTKDELKGLRNVIERIPQFEEKLGFKLENISFSIDEPYLNIHGDFFMDDLNNFDVLRIDIFATIYDQDDFILASENTEIYKEDFLGFETFTISIRVPDDDLKAIRKIRIYPKPYS